MIVFYIVFTKYHVELCFEISPFSIEIKPLSIEISPFPIQFSPFPVQFSPAGKKVNRFSVEIDPAFRKMRPKHIYVMLLSQNTCQ